MRDPGRVAAWIKQELEQENQAYTFVGGLFVERMTPQEVESVETALKTRIEAIREHIEAALRILSDRDNPTLETASRSRYPPSNLRARNSRD
jgi:hypothetical protein